MKKTVACAVWLLFLIASCPLNVFAQSSDETLLNDKARVEEEKKAAEAAVAAAAEKEARMREYGEKKADLELQLATLSKDRKIAAQDKNKELESKRAAEIRETRKQIKNLNKEYEIDDGKEDDSESASKAGEEKKKSETKLDISALNREFERELAKIEGRYYEEEKPAPAKKSPAKKKNRKKQ
ncbi:MAG: hypothetical protein LBU09_04035 [Endomicrobium sp.]|nr:hypothetical protein [Endomicrobium sp.]